MTDAEHAAQVLAHYFRLALPDAGPDLEGEIAGAVDALVSAARAGTTRGQADQGVAVEPVDEHPIDPPRTVVRSVSCESDPEHQAPGSSATTLDGRGASDHGPDGDTPNLVGLDMDDDLGDYYPGTR